MQAPQKRLVFSTHVNYAQALASLGHTGQELDDSLRNRFASIAAACEEELQAFGSWRVYDVQDQNRTADGTPVVTLAGTSLTLPGSSMQGYLEHANKVFLFACTLGANADRKLAELQATKPLDALLYSACANTCIESAAEQLQDIAAQTAREQGLFARMRFSPGYGDLPISIQEEFLGAINAQIMLGISTTPSHFMTPSKSISAVIGLYSRREHAKDYALCSECTACDYCSYHAKGTTCYGN